MGNIIKIPVPVRYEEIKSTILGFSQVKTSVITFGAGNDKWLEIEFQDTATAQQELDFKLVLANLINDSDSPIKYLPEIQNDVLIYNTEISVTKNNVVTAYIDLFNDYGGRSFFIDTTGFKKIIYQVFWKTNGGTGTNSLRVVNHSNPLDVLFEINVSNGQNQDTGLLIPKPLFENFRGRVRIQVKSTVASDSPTCDAVRLYFRRQLN